MDWKKKVENISNDIIDATTKASDTVTKTAKDLVDGVDEFSNKIKNIPSDISYIKDKNKQIQSLIEKTNNKIEPIREKTNSKLEELGKVKVDILSTTINEFTKHMEETNNLPFNSNINTKTNKENFTFSKQELDDMQVSVISIKNILKHTTSASVAGAISAGATYSTIAALGMASTGTFISTLSGAAASNATLAWLGGGALAAGGGGMALGAVVLGGIAIVPAVSYLIWKGKFDYTEEKSIVDKNYNEVREYEKNIDAMIKNFTELIKLIDNSIILIKEYAIECNKLNKQTDHIKHQLGLNYTKYNDLAKTLIKKHITYTQKLLNLLNTPVMNEDGSFNVKMLDILEESNKFIKDNPKHEFIKFEKKSYKKIYSIIVISILLLGYITYQYYF